MTIPTFDPNVPERPDDSLAETQPEFFNNFSTLFNSFGLNHVPLNAISGVGNHTILQLLQQNNSQQTGLSEISIYSKNVPDQTDQVFLKYQNGTELQFTNYQLYAIDPNTFFTFLPGKVILYFGLLNNIPNPFTLQLNPAICKNIFSCSFCPTNSPFALGEFKPSIGLAAEPGGPIDRVIIHGDGGLTRTLSYYYAIMGNA